MILEASGMGVHMMNSGWNIILIKMIEFVQSH